MTDSTTYDNEYLKSATINLRENAISMATLVLDNQTGFYPDLVDVGDYIKLYVGEDTSNLDTIFYGRLRFPVQNMGDDNTVTLSLVHYGYCLRDMLVGNEYGAQSINSTDDTITEIVNDIIDNYVEKILGSATASGYTLDGTNIDTISDVINYVDFPYKPADKSINDLVDLVTALNAGAASCHWHVDNGGYFRLKELGTNQAGGGGADDWHLWYEGANNSAGQATITVGEHTRVIDYEELQAEANYVLYYGQFRRPSNGDGWTESHSPWSCSSTVTLSTDAAVYEVGSNSVKALINGVGPPSHLWRNLDRELLTADAAAAQKDVTIADATYYSVGDTVYLYDDTPDEEFAVIASKAGNTLTMVDNLTNAYTQAQNAYCQLCGNWDFSKMGNINYIPILHFLASRSGLTSEGVYLYHDNSNYMYINYYNSVAGINTLASQNTFYAFNFPVGPYWRSSDIFRSGWGYEWSETGTMDWTAVNWIEFDSAGAVNEYANIDGLCFGFVPLCRVAYNSDLPQDCKMRLITDNVGKDDSLVESDDSGVMAQLAYAELLRLQKAVSHATIQTPLLTKAMPGNQFSYDSTTYRATEIIHELNGVDCWTTLKLTTDVLNGRARRRYEDLNKVYGNLRPEFQDRQASSMKAGTVDWRISRLAVDYA